MAAALVPAVINPLPVDRILEFAGHLKAVIVPEVNPQAVHGYAKKNIIANPNCSTAQMVVALKPLHDVATIKRIVVSTYQSVSGAGRSGVDELERQSVGLFNLKEIRPERFPRQIAFNVLPHVDVFLDDGYTVTQASI